MINEKGFNAALKRIKTNADTLAQAIHEAGLFAIAQVNEHGNDGFGARLVEAMGKKHDAQRVVTWLCHFGKFGVKNNKLVYRARKDITPDKLDSFLKNAEVTPYWELTRQPDLKFKVDYLSMLTSILKRHEKAEELRDEGKEVDESNVAVLDEVKAIIAKYQEAAKKATAAPAQDIVLDTGVVGAC